MPPRKPRRVGETEIDTRTMDWPQWVKDAQTENAELEVYNGRVIWWGGTWHDGLWKDGDWLGGSFRDGIWYAGNFMQGIWYNGDWRTGYFGTALWHDGVFRDGLFRGTWLGGLWLGGDFDGYCEKTGRRPDEIFFSRGNA